MELSISALNKSSVFDVEYKEALIHQVVVAQLAGKRQGTHQQKNRSAVSGGGVKPYRQKGTGRARAGTIRSPIWIGGGMTFARKPRDYSQKVNRKMYRGAIRSILSELIRTERLVVANEITLASGKTKELAAKLNELSLKNVLIVLEKYDEMLSRAASNIPKVDVVLVSEINAASLISHKKVLLSKSALGQLEEQLA